VRGAEQTILTYPDARLAQTAQGVAAGDGSVGALVAALTATMYAAQGRGLAAPQIGDLRRVFVIDTEWKSGTAAPRAFVNPALDWTSDDRATLSEGCLSIPGLSVPVTRPAAVLLSWDTADGMRAQDRFDGFAAACVQHELDHLNGVLTLDHLPPGDREAVLEGYRP